MTKFCDLSPSELIYPREFECECGKTHVVGIKYLDIAPGAIANTPRMLEAVGSRHPMLVCGPNSYRAAGARLEQLLRDAGIDFSTVHIPCHNEKHIAPSELASGSIMLNFDPKCDSIIAVGSGVINDLCKCAAVMAGIPTMVVATAPSMDGYASNGAAMEVNNIKLSLSMKYPVGIICDTEIMAQAPMRMLWAGLGDMLAKYTALCEWRITELICDEPYCPEIAQLVRESLSKIRQGAAGVRQRKIDSIQSISEGLVLSGIAMSFAGVSRPASGLEHYFSHCWEMMALAQGWEYDLHGIQVGIGTLLTMQVYRYLSGIKPSIEKAIVAADHFDSDAWENNIRRVFKATADDIIEMEKQTQKNERSGRLLRAQKIIDNWDCVCQIIKEELPPFEEIYGLMKSVGMPTAPKDIGLSIDDAMDAFICSRDVRNKYLISSLIWDIGFMPDCAQWLREQIEK